jgi:hypothetical protein
MPIPPPPASAPYDTLDSVLNSARVRMNDAIQSIGGDILTDEQPFTQEMANDGWRRLQSFLANLGYTRLKKPLVLYGFPVVASTDPASWTTLDWSFYFDGVSFWTAPNVGLFPADFILPLRVGERVTGSNSRFAPMAMAKDELPQTRKTAYNGWWLWENDTLYMPGSVYSMDLRFEYAAFLGDFLTSGSVEWYQQPVPIMRSKNALSYYICAEAAGAREDMDADPFILKAEQEARLIFNQEVSQKQRVPTQRRPYSGSRGGWGNGQGYGEVW